jgi:hypothetical protein
VAEKRCGTGVPWEDQAWGRPGVARCGRGSAVIARGKAGFILPEDSALLLQDNERGGCTVGIIGGQAAVKDQFKVEEAGMRFGSFGVCRKCRASCAMG